LPAYGGKIRIKSLSVIGSYARGAPTCGDLDLLLDLEVARGALNAPAESDGGIVGEVRT
jgi:predicted nucleotidyltransferase